MKIALYTTLLFACVAFSHSKNPGNFEINGTFTGNYSGKIIMTAPGIHDTTLVINGKFSFTGFSNDTVRAYLRLQGQSLIQDFYLENSKITLLVSCPNCGGKDSNALKNFNLDTVIGSTATRLQANFDDEMNLISDQQVSDSIKAQRIYKELFKLMSAHPSNPVSASSYSWYARKLSFDQAATLYAMIDTGKAASEEAKLAASTFQQIKKELYGNKFTDFEEPNPQGVNIKSADFRGKMLLVDFWASWCGPCRAQIPTVKKIYDQFHAKGLEIISVSLDSDKSKWTGAIDKEGLTWTNVSDLKGWQNQVAVQYQITSIPHMMLIDQKGNIINPAISPEELTNELQKRLK